MVDGHRRKDPLPLRGHFVHRVRGYVFLFICMLIILGLYTWVASSWTLSGWTLISMVLVAAFVGAVLLEFASAIFSHVATAPSIMLARQVLEQAAKGDFSAKIQVSRVDPLRPLLEDLNLAIANIREFVAEDRQRLSRSAEAVHEARLSLDARHIGTLNRALSEMEDVTGRFHLTEGDNREPTGEWVRGAASANQEGYDGP